MRFGVIFSCLFLFVSLDGKTEIIGVGNIFGFESDEVCIYVNENDGGEIEILSPYFKDIATYEKPEQVIDVLLKLADEVKAGKDYFVFPTQDEYNAATEKFEERRRNIRNLRETQRLIRKCIAENDFDSAESLVSYAEFLLGELKAA